MLVARGDVNDTDVTEIIGAFCTLVGLIWSAWAKRQADQPRRDLPPHPMVGPMFIALFACLVFGAGCAGVVGDPAKRCEYYSAAYLAYQATAEVRADDLSKEEIMAARSAAIFLRAYCGWTSPQTKGGPEDAEITDANGVLILHP